MIMSDKLLMVIDGSSLVHRAFFAIPFLSNKNGVNTNAVYGFLNMLYKIRDEYKPTNICVAFDRKGPTFRHEEFKDYKGTRDKTPPELSQQFPLIKEALENLGIKTIDLSKYEADDIAGTLAKEGEEKGYDVFLVTGDKDYFQLATDKVKVLLTKKGVSEMETYDRYRILEEYEIEPKAFVDIKGLMGDSSDNIPGIQGVGEKTALKLIKEFENLDGVYENIEKVSGAKLKEKLVNSKELAYLSRKLGEIITDVPLNFSVEDLTPNEEDKDKLLAFYENLELNSLINKIKDLEPSKPETFEEQKILKLKDNDDVKEMANKIVEKGSFYFKILTDDDYILTNPIYMGISLDGIETWVLDFRNDDINLEILRAIFESKDIEKFGWDVKSDVVKLMQMGWDCSKVTFDSSIAQYIIDPSQSNLSINKIAEDYNLDRGIDFEELVGKGKKKQLVSDIEQDKVFQYIGYILSSVYKLKPIMTDIITQRNMNELFNNVEMPLMKVLAEMEVLGVALDKDELTKLGIEYQEEIDDLVTSIYYLAGYEFNINSTKQLGDVLFDSLELPVIKKTKTGYSTDVEVLEALKDKHPIIEKIIRYRQIVKLKSTYIDGLQPMINPKTGRIHSKFNQTVTSTGRISSTDPNLQNIPIRTEDGRKIRKAFVAEKPDYVFLDGDYSQIELRLLAHISKDPKMIEAFNNEEDIHTKTAAEVFGIPKDEITSDLRYKAKAVNFSIIYGISDFSLSIDLGITRKEARKYIDNYFENYKFVKEYMDTAIATGKEKGYVETLLNRRRYIPELDSKNFNIRSFGERVAMNMPIQGSAADIIKLAMVKVHSNLRAMGLKSKLILTIHDELIIEALSSEKEIAKEIMKETMENAIKLDVPLKVEVMEGDSWYDTK